MRDQREAPARRRHPRTGAVLSVLVLGAAVLSCQAPSPSPSSSPSPSPSATPLPAATPSPTADAADYAIDFTLAQADGPDFSLSDQLAEGPAVIVFFQRGGG